jgi:hypothetical protein
MDLRIIKTIRSLCFLLALLISYHSYAQELTNKPFSASSESLVIEKFKEVGFQKISKEAAVDRLKKHNVFFYDLSDIDKYSEENINAVLAAVSILPKNLNIMFPHVFISIKGLSTGTESANYNFHPNLEKPSFGEITLSKHWSKQNFEIKVGTILHEMGHHFNYVLGDLHFSNSWKNIDCSWKYENNTFKNECPEKNVSLYAETFPSEDWAESFVLYVLDKNKLEEISVNKFNFLDRLLSEDFNKDEFSEYRKTLKYFERSDKKMKNIPLYLECLNLTKNSNRQFCSSLSLLMLNSQSVNSITDLTSEKHTSIAFSLYLKNFNRLVKIQ